MTELQSTHSADDLGRQPVEVAMRLGSTAYNGGPTSAELVVFLGASCVSHVCLIL